MFHFFYDLFEAINTDPHINNCEVFVENPKRIKVTVGKAQGLNDVFRTFSELGIEISSMRNETGRLEELFLDLVEPSLKEKIDERIWTIQSSDDHSLQRGT